MDRRLRPDVGRLSLHLLLLRRGGWVNTTYEVLGTNEGMINAHKSWVDSCMQW